MKLTPTPAGRWRWVGTRTVLFDPDVRFPQATTYDVEVPAGTKAADGTALKAAVRWKFETPPPAVEVRMPNGDSEPTRPDFLLAFDQRIDPAAMLRSVRVVANGRDFPLVALSEAEAHASKSIRPYIDAGAADGRAGRWLAFRTTEALPTDAPISVAVKSGAPSAEGPRTTKADQTHSFRTYAPLRVRGHSCERKSDCAPGSPLYVWFNNALDERRNDVAQVRVEPSLGEDAHVEISGSSLSISGATKGRTTYTVTLPATLRDEHGQTLGRAEELEFRIGEAEPWMTANAPFTLADPAATKPTYDVHSMNIPSFDVDVYRVTPRDWAAYAGFLSQPESWKNNRRVLNSPPGTRVVHRELRAETKPDELVETRVELAEALRDGLGDAIVTVTPHKWPNEYPPRYVSWVSSTKLGLDAYVDASEFVAYVSNLADGKPAAGVAVTVEPFGLKATTGADGLAKFALPETGKDGVRMVVATRGSDTAMLPAEFYRSRDSGLWVRSTRGNDLVWHVFDDRQMYRPKEEVHLKGWVRRVGYGKGGDVTAFDGGTRQLPYRVYDAQNAELLKGTTTLSAAGAFDTKFTLPGTPNLGYARVEFDSAGTSFSHGFQIQEFRRPTYEVNVATTDGPFVVGESANATVTANYYAGGGLARANVEWNVTATETTFQPPNWDDYVFGEWSPWWWDVGYGRGGIRPYGPPGRPSQTFSWSGVTDASGKHVLGMDFRGVNPARPMSLSLRAAVSDVNRQAWAGGAEMLVHPAAVYVGVHLEKNYGNVGDPMKLGVVVVDQEGKLRENVPAQITAARLDWVRKNGEYVEEEKDPVTCKVVSGKTPSACTFEPTKGGQYRVRALVRDEKGRLNEAVLSYWIAGGDLPPSRGVEQEKIELIPNAKEYAPGEKAKLLVRAPFAPATGVLTVRRSGILETRRIDLTGSTTTVEVPIVDAHTPNVWVQVDLVGAKVRTDDRGRELPKAPKRPAFASGSINLPVPPHHRTLSVEVKPNAAKLAPGADASVAVKVTDAQGKPMRDAEVAVVVVDEAVLALVPYNIPDPIPTFYPERSADVTDYHDRSYAVLASSGTLAMAAQLGGATTDVFEDSMMAGTGGGGLARSAAPPAAPMAEASVAADGMERPEMRAKKSMAAPGPSANAAPSIQLRTNMNALAVFAPAARTDASGNATVKYKLPDNLTRYRVVAVATDGAKQFGKGESTVTARKPLMVQPSAPRFLNYGDRFSLPIVLRNQTDKAMRVQVAARMTNATLTDGKGRIVDVPANDRVEVLLPAAAGEPGTARLQVAAASGNVSDAEELSLPVWTPATTEAFATYGEIDANGVVKQPVAMPKDVVTDFGGLELETSSTQLQALTDAFLYLERYPYDCAEQRASRVLAIAALRDVLEAFGAAGLPSKGEIEASMAADLKALESIQEWSGGFPFWPGGKTWPYVSVHAAHALARAKAAGYAVPTSMLERSTTYLRNIERHIPSEYGPEYRRFLTAYALYVRLLLGDRDTAKARAVLAEAGDKGMNLEGYGWLLAVFAGDAGAKTERAKLLRLFENRATETAGEATFASEWRDGAQLILYSERRADGVILDALIREAPKNDLIPKIVRGMLAHRKRGAWGNTQENTFILLALHKYFVTYENVTPDFVARAWLGDRFAGEQTFKGRSTDRVAIDIPMRDVAAVGKADLTLQKQGAGRLYYRIGMTYAPSSLWLAPADHGFAVDREYTAIDDPKDVEHFADGSWKIRAGARVKVT
ncbi:MAG: hypothetical protein KC417_09325, partial [Myxococcales bacterium]|nr:hypothetical protein [Myxococcales bacterium]